MHGQLFPSILAESFVRRDAIDAATPLVDRWTPPDARKEHAIATNRNIT